MPLKPVVNRGQREQGLGGGGAGNPQVPFHLQMSETCILSRLLRMYFLWTWEFDSCLSKLRNFGEVWIPPTPLGTPLSQIVCNYTLDLGSVRQSTIMHVLALFNPDGGHFGHLFWIVSWKALRTQYTQIRNAYCKRNASVVTKRYIFKVFIVAYNFSTKLINRSISVICLCERFMWRIHSWRLTKHSSHVLYEPMHISV
jgi:hypothetical protein